MMASIEKVLIRRPVMRSFDVDEMNSHKMWWGDVVRLDNGQYQIITYAQLFSASGKPGELRTYPQNKTFAFPGAALNELNRKYKYKEARRGYEHFSDRENEYTSVSSQKATEEQIIQFLKKYGSIAS